MFDVFVHNLALTHLKFSDIVVTDAVVLVDREQGAADNIAKQGVKVHSLFPLSLLLNILHDIGKIEKDMVKLVAKYIKENQVQNAPVAKTGKQKKCFCYLLYSMFLLLQKFHVQLYHFNNVEKLP